MVSLQLLPYLENSGLLQTYQSGFRANHSTETALLSLLSDIYSAIDKSQLSLCICCFRHGRPPNPPWASWDLVWNLISSSSLDQILPLWPYSNECLRWIQDFLGSYIFGCPPWLCAESSSLNLILLIFTLSFQNIRLLVISLLTTFRHMFMVLLLVNFFSPAKLNYSEMILTLGCLQIDSLWTPLKPSSSGSAHLNNSLN